MAAQAKTTQAKAAKTTVRRKSPTDVSGAAEKKQTLSQLQKEYKQLQAKLEASEARVAELEKVLEETANRVEWAIDLLQSTAADCD